MPNLQIAEAMLLSDFRAGAADSLLVDRWYLQR